MTKITNPDLLEDLLDIVVNFSQTYRDRTTGAVVQAIPISDIAPTLGGSINHSKGTLTSRRRWRNVSRIDVFDLKDSGFKTLGRDDGPNPRDGEGQWEDSRGRLIGHYTTLITL